MTSRTAEIKLTVDLDANNVATRIVWQAAEAPGGEPARCQSVMLALWDTEKQTTAAIDLWTREMTVDDMNAFFHQVLHKMADTYLRATKNDSVAQSISEFARAFRLACNDAHGCTNAAERKDRARAAEEHSS